MTIQSIDALVNAMGNNSSRLIFDKANLSNTVVGQFTSLWRAGGQPGVGLAPTTAASCDVATVGALQFTQQVAPAKSYLAILEGVNTVSGSTLEIHDRLVHQGGLSGALTTLQAVDLDLLDFLGADNMDARIGDANYSDVQWWLEWYTNTGAAAANATVNVTYNDGSTGDLLVVALAASRRLGLMQPLNASIPDAQAGKFIRGVNSVTLSISTGTAGNFGVTATRYRAATYLPVLGARFTSDWAQLGLPEIPNDACLFAVLIAGTTSTGLLRATGKIVHG